MTARIVFMDTETTGLEHDADVWDFAAIIRASGQEDEEVQFFVEHSRSKADRLPAPFFADYVARYSPATALTQPQAAVEIRKITMGAHIVGAVPNFDTERLAGLARSLGMTGRDWWHYHLIDVENLAVGYLRGLNAHGHSSVTCSESRNCDAASGGLPPPWDSENLSVLVGVDPGQFDRHTALGDARWARAIYDAVMGKP